MGPEQNHHQTTTASERLKRALERNRAKMARKEQGSNGAPPSPSSSSSRRVYSGRENIGFTTGKVVVERLENAQRAKGTSVGIFPWDKIKISSSKLVWAMWFLGGIVFLRLLFFDRGVSDFYARQKEYEARNNVYRSIEMENQKLRQEIVLLQKDSKYQKKIIREQLGYITEDEFLVMFAKD